MATPRSAATAESLAILSDAVNQTLIDTGRFFKSAGSLQSRAQLKASIPASYQRFQTALDTLTEQIRNCEETCTRATTHTEPAPVPEPVTAPEPPPTEDVFMPEAPVPTVGEQVKETIEKPEPTEKPIKTEPTTMPDSGIFGEQPIASTEPVTTTAATEPIEALKVEETADKGTQQLPVSMGDEMNFDQMLATTGQAPNDFDLNFNFTNDEIGDQNFLAGADFGNTNATMGGEINNDNGANTISSLLPGIEHYASNNAGDSFNFDLPKLGDQQNGGQDDLMAPGESSFDDLFLEKNDLEGDDNLLGSGEFMELGELDDSWLN
uniref:Titin n=1 Tax=Talaromyces marneffei PM1 TaxID=1077442 RepID=A0A093UUR9_TALMA